MRVILLGAPGSGKGTQAKLLSDRLGLLHLGTGDILREAIRTNTAVGRQAAPYVQSGQLVPDSLVNDLIAECFHRQRPELFVMDGYPRTLAQAVAFDQVLKQEFLDLCAVVWLNVPDEQVLARLLGRWVCPVCKRPYHVTANPPRVPGRCDRDGTPLIQREDDREAKVTQRLKEYHQNTEALVAHYQEQGLVREVAGQGDVEEIYRKIVKALNRQAGPPC